MFFRKKFSHSEQKNTIPVFDSMEENIQIIKKMMNHTNDLKRHHFRFNGETGGILYLETMADKKRIQSEILKPLLQAKKGIVEDVITSVHVKSVRSLNEVVDSLLQGQCAILFDDEPVIVMAEASLSSKRSVNEPENEGVVRGAHDGFIENLEVNLNLIRSRIENRNLRVKYYPLGKEMNTKVAVVYMEDLANKQLLHDLEERLNSISTDTIISPGYVAEFIEDNPYSPFPQLLFTERPDRAVAHLMEGRIVILAEGDPSAIILPVTLFAFYQSPDDFHTRWVVGTFVRLIRLASFVIAFQLPGIYIAVVGFHPEILPSDLIITVKSSVERVPYPPLLEAVFMELTMELIREAGIRLPSRVGQTIGIVGGLVIGDAVVQTGLVSLPMVIVVALTAIASYVVPSNEMSTAIRILRFPLMVAAAMFGFIGLTIGLVFILIHLCKLESLKQPYFAPVMPLRFKDLKDTFVRFPIWKLSERPHDAKPKRYKQETVSREWDQNDKKN